jgi:cystathionine gamma-lyase
MSCFVLFASVLLLLPYFTALGIVPSPFDCYLVNRSVKTLHIRMQEHMKNGLKVARYLEKHPLVEKVVHPGIYI